MAGESSKKLDETGWRLLRELQQDARLSFAELGRRVAALLRQRGADRLLSQAPQRQG